jgi:Insertion element 4 transposase N-terminal
LPVQSAMRSAVTTVTAVISVAAGVFAPGHLGEVTRVVPFELADAVLEEEGGLEKRVRLLSSQCGRYFLLAMCLFPRASYLGVWGKLTAGLRALGIPDPSPKALRDLRRRVGTRAGAAAVRDPGRAPGPAAHAGDHVPRLPDGVIRRLQVAPGA